MTSRHYSSELPVRLYEAEASVDTLVERFGIDRAAIVDFSLNVNPFGPPPSAVTAGAAALSRCHEYPDLRLSALRRVLARRHDVGEDALLFGAGLDDVIKLLVHALSSEGGRVLIHLPTFPRYELEARLRGAQVVLVEQDPPWRVDLQDFAAALEREPIELAFLCSPNNPTGELLAADPIAALVRAHPQTVFIVDEALLDPRHSGTSPQLRNASNAIVLRTFSKYFGLAGMRIGYAIGPPALLQLVERGRPPFNVSHAAEAAALAALDDAAFLDRCRAIFAEETRFVAAALEPLPGLAIRGRHANMLLIESLQQPTAELVDALGRKGLLVADAACFGGLGERSAIRVSLRERAVNQRLIDALERMR